MHVFSGFGCRPNREILFGKWGKKKYGEVGRSKKRTELMLMPMRDREFILIHE